MRGPRVINELPKTFLLCKSPGIIYLKKNKDFFSSEASTFKSLKLRTRHQELWGPLHSSERFLAHLGLHDCAENINRDCWGLLRIAIMTFSSQLKS